VQAKVSDFGLATGLIGTSTAGMTSRTKTHAAGGTIAYRAPETFGGTYTTASEVYSYAIVLWELLTGGRPWHRDENGKPFMEVHVMNLVANRRKRPELPSVAASSSPASRSRGGGGIIALMRRCWLHEPKKRPTFAHIIELLQPDVKRLSTDATVSLSQVQEMGHSQLVPEPLAGSRGSSSTSTSELPGLEPDVFISFRFGEARTEALALKAALDARGYSVFMSEVSPGGVLQKSIAYALSKCRLAVVLATKTYGRQTNGLFCTWAEMNFIVGKRKPFYLVRMIPFDDEWVEPVTEMAFPKSIMMQLWLPDTPMPDGMLDAIETKLNTLGSGSGGGAGTAGSGASGEGAGARDCELELS